jgi:uncharacterized protein YqgC (DUF456 family)
MAGLIIVFVCILAAVGWALSLIGISGTWLILVGAVGLDVAHDGSWNFIATTIIFVVLCAVAEGVEFLAGLLGAKAFGGSKSSQIGAFVGTIAGAIIGSFFMMIVGTILGALIGGFLGAMVGELRHQYKEYDGHDMKLGAKAGAKAGVGAMLAKTVAIGVKATLATMLVAWFIWIFVHHV